MILAALGKAAELILAEHERRRAAFTEARNAVGVHRRRLADIELERARWLRRHRGVPVDVLFDRETGDALDPQLAELERRLQAAAEDVVWCLAVEVATAEELKGESLETVMARNERRD